MYFEPGTVSIKVVNKAFKNWEIFTMKVTSEQKSKRYDGEKNKRDDGESHKDIWGIIPARLCDKNKVDVFRE